MRKVKLDLDALAVESFETDGETAERGTVVGNDSGDHTVDPNHNDTCFGDTCWDSCGGSCDTLCGWSPSAVYYNGVCV